MNSQKALKISRRSFMGMVAAGITSQMILPGCSNAQTPMSSKKHKPNIIILYADDLGYGELGCYGQTMFETPVIDKMAKEGMLFTDFYSGNTVCAPSRCSLMTGKDPGHATIRGNCAIGDNDMWYRIPLKKEEKTIGEVMKQAGYITAIFGKWHLEDPRDDSTWAHNRGFDYTCHYAWPWKTASKEIREDFSKHIWVNGEKKLIEEVKKPGEFICLDDHYTSLALPFIEKHKDKPFFLFMSYKIPHTPESDLDDKEIYKDKGWPWTERQHAGRITTLDRLIGQLLNKVKELGLEEETLIFLTSDNGGHKEGGHDHNFFKSNAPLKGAKRDLYEGGIRVPAIAYWKGTIKPGQTTSLISAQWDLLPTCADIAGAPIPKDVTGISFLPELKGLPQKKHEYLYWEFQLDGWWQKLPTGGFRQAVRMGKWKGVRYALTDPTELYDLETDIGEDNNIADKHPEIVKKINKLFKEARTEHPGFPYGGKIQNYRAMDAWRQ